MRLLLLLLLLFNKIKKNILKLQERYQLGFCSKAKQNYFLITVYIIFFSLVEISPKSQKFVFPSKMFFILLQNENPNSSHPTFCMNTQYNIDSID